MEDRRRVRKEGRRRSRKIKEGRPEKVRRRSGEGQAKGQRRSRKAREGGRDRQSHLLDGDERLELREVELIAQIDGRDVEEDGVPATWQGGEGEL